MVEYLIEIVLIYLGLHRIRNYELKIKSLPPYNQFVSHEELCLFDLNCEHSEYLD